ncbi:S26 family signal peptidase [uncultured Erythrobacter sp.]|uniref:S26 family signal peptidase n=1 Tax=uncultured Erythrobacter sp. TaxID=263913 RepID=UPI00260BFA64|nr:S26 family signal peptidase [uncultured Erythrobacter sp.]
MSGHLSWLAAGAMGLAGIAFATLADPMPRYVWNGSASVARGLYRIEPCPCERGDLVLARLSGWAERMAVKRRYLPEDTPVLKRVVAAEGDEICRMGSDLRINGALVVTANSHDSYGHPMPVWSGCHALSETEILLLADHPGSFDGRYFGPIESSQIIGCSVAVWTFDEAVSAVAGEGS